MLAKLHNAPGPRANPVIFFASATLTIVSVVASIAFTGVVDRTFANLSELIKANLGWLYILGVTGFLVFLVWIAFSRFGNVRLEAGTRARSSATSPGSRQRAAARQRPDT